MHYCHSIKSSRQHYWLFLLRPLWWRKRECVCDCMPSRPAASSEDQRCGLRDVALVREKLNASVVGPRLAAATCQRPTCPQHPHAPRIRRCRQRNEVAPASDAITATDTERLPTNGTVTLKQNLCVHGCERERHRGGQGAGIGEAERENKLRQTRCHAAQLYS